MKDRFSRLDQIGIASAEEDDLLKDCFLDAGYVDYVKNMNDKRVILLGRTGSGKSAIIKYLYETEERILIVQPEKLSLSYILNTSIIESFINMGVNFNLFFKMLWRHVLSVEIIRYHMSLHQVKDTQKWFQIITGNNKSKKAEKALKYLEQWGSKFWEETDYRVKEITDRFAAELRTRFGNEIVGIGADVSSDEEVRTEVIKKAQNYVNSIQLNELNNVLDALNDLIDDHQKRYLIFIDNLDEEWIDDIYRYKLIKSLIETARDFNKVDNVKIIIALREDLLNRVIEKTRSEGFQKEKYDDLCFRITWDKEQLVEIINRRMKTMYLPYKKKGSNLRAYLPDKVNKEDPIDYIVDRTLMRPRDMISFVNTMIKRADKKTLFSSNIVRDAETEYSKSRLDALADEWYTDAPNFIRSIELIRGRPESFKPDIITDSECEDFCINLIVNRESKNFKIGRIYKIAKKCVEQEISINEFRCEYLIILYEIGLIGLKLHKNEKTMFFIDEHRDIRSIEIESHTKVQVHKAFWQTLNIRI